MVQTEVTCSACEKKTTVPFKPTKGRPVYCKSCYDKKKASRARGGSAPKKQAWDRSEYQGFNPDKHATGPFS